MQEVFPSQRLQFKYNKINCGLRSSLKLSTAFFQFENPVVERGSALALITDTCDLRAFLQQWQKTLRLDWQK